MRKTKRTPVGPAIVREEPPELTRGRAGGLTKQAHEAAQANPGEWFRVRVCAAGSVASSFAQRLVRGGAGFEARSGKIDGSDPPQWGVWIRYTP